MNLFLSASQDPLKVKNHKNIKRINLDQEYGCTVKINGKATPNQIMTKILMNLKRIHYS